ncbi:MAG: TetR/AcrR family transcriptional regulator [Woeseia sp.]|nr:TetR/AcrR family transcriptional regulator [Woeseia sp.]MBT8095933.1 TetR/AcrR family transcriptional regulator [Woeseia sp.]NNE61079.1 TetR/AcrR family transcriptional regulator [Woeseia sp.]NNL53759.1 TetR/AcrR family transcriptional regulator [Woeseia sp.]
MAQSADETRFQLKHERILRAAARCFNEKGYSGTSLKDVSRHLGLTDAALYYYVRNKEELVFKCYQRAAQLGAEAMTRAESEGRNGLEQAQLYLHYHIEIMVGERGPVAIMSEVPSLKPAHRDEILTLSRQHSRAFEEVLARGIGDGSIAECDVRMTGNAIMGAINWIPKWFHGSSAVAAELIIAFPDILTRGLATN